MAKICFIVGHGKSKTGGYDPGATNGKFEEFKIVKEIAKHAQKHYNDNYNERADLMNYEGNLYLQDRINKLKDDTYDFIAEIHMNSSTSKTATGTECYYYHGSERGQKYADTICDSISAALDVPQRKNGTDEDGGDKVKLNDRGQDYFGIIRSTKPCAVLVETVFISNSSDLNKVKTAAGQKRCGIAIAEAIAKCRGLKKKVSTPTTETSKETPKETPKEQPTKTFEPYTVKVTAAALNIRKGPGINNEITGCITTRGVYTIVGESAGKGSTKGWGKLKSGAGWISLDYTNKC